MQNNDPVNWEENSELRVVRLHNFNLRDVILHHTKLEKRISPLIFFPSPFLFPSPILTKSYGKET